MSVHKPVLVVTTRFMDEIEARIDRDYIARRSPHERPFTCDELIEASSGADALFITPFDRLDSDFFKRLPASVKVIATYSVGIDHIDLPAATNRKIAIAYTPGVNADATADIAMLLMLGASRRAYEGQELVRTGTWKFPGPVVLGWQLTGKTLGIVGMGRVGQAVAERARGFGMSIHYVNPTRLPVALEKGAVFHSCAADLLRAGRQACALACDEGAGCRVEHTTHAGPVTLQNISQPKPRGRYVQSRNTLHCTPFTFSFITEEIHYWRAW